MPPEQQENSAAPTDVGAGPEPTFRERKMQALREEDPAPVVEQQPAPRQEADLNRAPDSKSDLAVQDGDPELHSDEGSLDDDYEDDPENLYDETLSDELGDDPDPEAGNWEKRYKDTQAKMTEVAEERNAIEREFTESIEGNLRLKHEIEDKMQKADTFLSVIGNGIDSQIANLEQAFRSGQVPPEQMGEARQRYQQLSNQKGQLEQTVTKMSEERAEVDRKTKERQAEITRARLARTIPGWGPQKYAEMREFATGRGYTAEEFNDHVDHRYFELLNDSMTLHSAPEAVNVRKKRRAQAPVGSMNKDRRSRDGRGRYRQERAEKTFRDSPNQKGAFAGAAFERLRREK